MKRFSSVLLPALLIGAAASNVQAQSPAPRTISFQGVLADANGVFMSDGPHQLTLTIYDAAAGGVPVFIETQTVMVVRGTFNAIIGSTSPNGIPTGVTFDRAYYLGVNVDGGAELAPRTPMTSVPYALRATLADSAAGSSRAVLSDRALLADSAKVADRAAKATLADNLVGGVVTNVNGQQGAVQIVGAGGTSVTMSGNKVVIGSPTAPATGIASIQNFDGTMIIDPATGPNVTVTMRSGGIQTQHLANTAVTTQKIADDAVTSTKIQDGGITTADVANGAITDAKIASGISYGKLVGAPTSLPPSGAAGGDLSGTYPAPSVAQVGGVSAANVAGGANKANAATSLPIPGTIVMRDANGDFTAGTITGNLIGNATTATTALTANMYHADSADRAGSAVAFTGTLAGDVTGTMAATQVATVGGVTAANVATGANRANAATNLSTPSTIVMRDANGDFAAGTITGTLNGNAATATSALSANHAVLADSAISAAQAVSANHAILADSAISAASAVSANHAILADSAISAASAVSANHAVLADSAVSASMAVSANHAVLADSANVAASAVTASHAVLADSAVSASMAVSANHAVLADSANVAASAVSASHAVLADSATVAASAVTAGHAVLADSATVAASAVTAGHAVLADSANVAASAVTANHAVLADSAISAASASHAILADSAISAASAVSATNAIHADSSDISGSAVAFTGTLAGDVTGNMATTQVATVGGVSSANVASGANAANAATSSFVPSTIVKRDVNGDFTAGTITASLIGNATTATTAATATHAVLADSTLVATSAVSATHAVLADSAIVAASAASATHAVLADSAIVAASAVSANHAILADSAISAASAVAFTGNLVGDVTSLGMTTSISDGAVTTAKIAPMAATTGQSIMFDGTNVVWGTATANLQVPFAATATDASALFNLTNNGTGVAGQFKTALTGGNVLETGLNAEADVTSPVANALVNGIYAIGRATSVSNATASVRGILAEGYSDGALALGTTSSGIYTGTNTTVGAAMPMVIGTGSLGRVLNSTRALTAIGATAQGVDPQAGANYGLLAMASGGAYRNMGVVASANATQAQLGAAGAALPFGATAGTFVHNENSGVNDHSIYANGGNGVYIKSATGNTTGLEVNHGRVVLSYDEISASDAGITLPDGASVIVIEAGATAAFTATLPNGTTVGQLLTVFNSDGNSANVSSTNVISGPAAIATGTSVQYVWVDVAGTAGWIAM